MLTFFSTMNKATSLVTILEDYTNQDHSLAWHALTHWWPIESNIEQRAMAHAVALEFATRAMKNMRLIKECLDSLGYQFLNYGSALVPAPPDAIVQIEEFENEHGTLPIVLKAWYTVFHSIDFRQSPKQICGEGVHEKTPLMGLGFNCSLVFDPFDVCASNIEPSFRPKANGRSFFPTGAYCSNNDPMGMDFPTRRFDDVFYNDGGGDVLFGNAIRAAIRCCGFQYWWIVTRGGFSGLGSLHGTPEYSAFYNMVQPQLTDF